MDMSTAIVPKSDQINADDLLAGPRTFTIERVTEGNSEQPVNIHLLENPGKPYRPGKSMSRVLVKAWGKDSDAYAGQRLTLYCDPDVKWGGEKVGGIRISHMTNLPDGKPLKVALTETRGRKAPFTVQPLPDAPAAPTITPEEIAACSDKAELGRMWKQAGPTHRKQIEARVAELDAEAEASNAPADGWEADEQQPLDVEGQS